LENSVRNSIHQTLGEKKMRPVARTVTALAVASVAAAGVLNATRPGVQEKSVKLTAGPLAQAGSVGSMRSIADQADLKFGTAVNMDVLASNEKYATITSKEFNSVTPENVMKWESVEPSRGNYDWSKADALVEFAKKNNQFVRGHTLVWHSQMPDWLKNGIKDGEFSPPEVRKIMKDHIVTVAKHFKGKIKQWDVANEAFNESGSERYTLWREYLGKNYLADAFRSAHAVDPKAKLFYNDFNIEGMNPKSDAVYALVKKLKTDGVPIDGVGIQSHLATQLPFPPGYAENLKRFAELGLEISLTEVDVRIELPVTSAKIANQKSQYQELFAGCLAVKECDYITLWGFDDGNSWIRDWFGGEGSATPFYANYKPKPVWSVIKNSMMGSGR
jgi:endo-1,4-beta-xylanase